MNETPLYIEKDTPVTEGQDFYFLRKEGVQLLQEWCGHIWTDYNEHDPGITMLEQLCYALTSLFYLTETPLRDLLIDKTTGKINTTRQALFIPKDIYPCNPLTAIDYRKLLLDRCAGIGNVWLLPAGQQDTIANVDGLYKIGLYVPQAVGEMQVKEEVKKIYNAHRNLCEDVGKVQVLKKIPLQLYADVAFSNTVTPESLLARIFFEVNQYMAPEVRRHSLEDMLAGGYTADELMEGALLLNGFIADSDLQPKAAMLFVNQIEKAILGIQGIENIRNVFVKHGQEIVHQKIAVPEDTVCIVNTSPTANKSFTIRFFNKGTEYLPDPVRVQRELMKLYQQLRLRYKLDLQYEKYFGIPTGQYKPVENYYSIQNQFPIVYGINQFGLLRSDTPERKAQAKQLKAYLLVFEQLMADFQAQLAHVRDLFSIDPNVKHTCFYQSIEHAVPNVKPVLKKDCGGYKEGLKRLVNSMDPYVDRRNRFLAYLLALYGETIPEYAISPYNSYKQELPPAERLLKARLLFLQHLVTSTRNRGKGFNYLHTPEPANIPGMEWKIRILLGMPVPPQLSLQEVFGEYEFKLAQTDEKVNNLLPATTTPGDYINNHYEPIDGYEKPEAPADETHQKLPATLPLLKERKIDDDFINYATDPGNYRMGLDKMTNEWELVLRHDETTPWKKLGIFKYRGDALAAAHVLVEIIRDCCHCCNTLHIVEHTLLRYALQQEDHSIVVPGNSCNAGDTVYAFPFSFHLSVIFSGCRELINNPDYRSFAEKTVAANLPAHIIAHYYWLSPCQMLAFEEVLGRWKAALTDPEKNKRSLAILSTDIIRFLKKYRPINTYP